MKKPMFFLCAFCCISALGRPQTVFTPDPRTPAAQRYTNATLVSHDADARTVTIRDGRGPVRVLPVALEAIERLRILKAGDQVLLALQRTVSGTDVVVDIKRSTPSARRSSPGRALTRSVPTVSTPSSLPSPAPVPTPTPAPSPSPVAERLPTDVVGPSRDPRVGTQQDPRVAPNRDPRIIPGLTEPASPVPTPSPSP